MNHFWRVAWTSQLFQVTPKRTVWKSQRLKTELRPRLRNSTSPKVRASWFRLRCRALPVTVTGRSFSAASVAPAAAGHAALSGDRRTCGVGPHSDNNREHWVLHQCMVIPLLAHATETLHFRLWCSRGPCPWLLDSDCGWVGVEWSARIPHPTPPPPNTAGIQKPRIKP